MTSTVVWDFDWSLINCNSDIVVPEQLGSPDVHEFVKTSIATVQWTDLMHQTVQRLYDEGVTEQDIRRVLGNMDVFPAHIEVIRSLTLAGTSQHIVSDANTVYIQAFLDHHGLLQHFKSISTNPSRFENGRLHIARYHSPDLEPHRCPRCPQNMCKGGILRDLGLHDEPELAQQSSEALSHAIAAGAGAAEVEPPPITAIATEVPAKARVVYVGDGGGDLCPCLLLGPRDVICARAGYPLAKALQKAEVQPLVRARVVEWADGDQLAAALRQATGLT